MYSQGLIYIYKFYLLLYYSTLLVVLKYSSKHIKKEYLSFNKVCDVWYLVQNFQDIRWSWPSVTCILCMKLNPWKATKGKTVTEATRTRIGNHQSVFIQSMLLCLAFFFPVRSQTKPSDHKTVPGLHTLNHRIFMKHSRCLILRITYTQVTSGSWNQLGIKISLSRNITENFHNFLQFNVSSFKQDSTKNNPL